MNISTSTISSDRTTINLTIEDAASLSALRIWSNKTYKDYNKVIDLTSKLTGSATENITITLSDLSLPYFDGVYFIEAEDDSELSLAIVFDLTRYKECILEKVVTYTICNDCLALESLNMINAQALLVALEIAIESRFIDEILNIIKTLDRYCSNACRTCGDYKNIVNNEYYSSNNS